MPFDDLEDLRRYLRKKIEEIEEIFVGMHEETSEEYPDVRLHEPLHSLYDLGDKYMVVVDVPWADDKSVLVNAFNNILEVKVKLKRKVKAGELGYRFVSEEIEEYHKKILLPRDADVSRLDYQVKSSRIIITLPKTST